MGCLLQERPNFRGSAGTSQATGIQLRLPLIVIPVRYEQLNAGGAVCAVEDGNGAAVGNRLCG